MASGYANCLSQYVGDLWVSFGLVGITLPIRHGSCSLAISHRASVLSGEAPCNFVTSYPKRTHILAWYAYLRICRGITVTRTNKHWETANPSATTLRSWQRQDKSTNDSTFLKLCHNVDCICFTGVKLALIIRFITCLMQMPLNSLSTVYELVLFRDSNAEFLTSTGLWTITATAVMKFISSLMRFIVILRNKLTAEQFHTAVGTRPWWGRIYVCTMDLQCLCHLHVYELTNY